MSRVKLLITMMRTIARNDHARAALILLVTLLALSACATSGARKAEIVQAGGQADVRFTCRLGNGELAVSTYTNPPGWEAVPRSSIFVKPGEDGPMKLTAGKDPAGLKKTSARGFEGGPSPPVVVRNSGVHHRREAHAGNQGAEGR